VAEAEGLACPECGADDWAIVQPEAWEGFREWVRGGGLRASRGTSRRCSRCGFVEPLGGVFYIAHRAGWWSVPWRLIRAILDRRTMIPAPYIYLGALAVGAALGGALDAWLGWSWWAVALVFLSGVWLVFLSSAFFGARPDRKLRLEILDAVHPSGSVERWRREEERVFRECPFPFYGLDGSWTGIRMLGGHGSRGTKGTEVTSVELAHGGPGEGGSWVRVETALESRDWPRDLHQTAVEFWGRVERPPADLPPHLKGAWHHRRFERNLHREANWSKVSIPVDADLVEFDQLQHQGNWVARARLDELVVRVNGNRFPVASVRLVTIADVEPYIEGSRRYEDEQGRQHEG
jgi:hypothetical protein